MNAFLNNRHRLVAVFHQRLRLRLGIFQLFFELGMGLLQTAEREGTKQTQIETVTIVQVDQIINAFADEGAILGGIIVFRLQ